MEKLIFDLDFLSGKRKVRKETHTEELEQRGTYEYGRHYSKEDYNKKETSFSGNVIIRIIKFLFTNPIGWIILFAIVSNS